MYNVYVTIITQYMYNYVAYAKQNVYAHVDVHVHDCMFHANYRYIAANSTHIL